jgi:hypothetical protein
MFKKKNENENKLKTIKDSNPSDQNFSINFLFRKIGYSPEKLLEKSLVTQNHKKNSQELSSTSQLPSNP